MSQEVEAGTSGDVVPSPPILPTLPAPPPRAPAAPRPATLAADFFAQQTPSRAASTKKKGGAGRVLRRLFTLLLVVGVLGGAGVVGYRYYAGLSDDFPTFTEAAPQFESISIQIEGYDDAGEPQKYTVTTNAQTSVIDLQVVVGELGVPVTEIITDGTTAFVRSTDGTWVYGAYDNGDGQYDALAAVSHLSTWNDLVPKSVQEHATVISTTEDEIDGTAVTKYELAVEMKDFSRDDPEGYSAWAAYAGADDPPSADLGRLIVWVDEQGIVWRISTYADGEEDRPASISLVSYSTEPFVPPYPTEFTDTLNAPEAAIPSS